MSKDERCVDHCDIHALSSPTDPSFKANCDHVHNIVCDACSGVEDIVGEIGLKSKTVLVQGLMTELKESFSLSMRKPKRPLVRGRLITCALATNI